MSTCGRRRLRAGARTLGSGLAIVVLAGCASRHGLEVPPAQRLSAEVREVLGTRRTSAEYHRERRRLQEMGPDLDVILIGLIGDTRARTDTRADALVLLADRRSPLALPTLQSALRSDNERIRSAAVLGLNRLSTTHPVAVDLIRDATRDRSRLVRLNALQSLNVREVESIRDVLEAETDAEVRQVGLQLVALAEARGAPLAADFRGSLRTSAGEREPQIVFRPVTQDTSADLARGDLRVELWNGPDIPLSSSATVVSKVVPAFFSPDRSAVVYEADGEIRVVDISTREVRSFGPGMAPRQIPFAQQFVFLRERGNGGVERAGEREIAYDVYRAPFAGGRAERIGELTASARADTHGGESPVRWMVVDEVADGFVLRAERLEPFLLPVPTWSPAAHGRVSEPGARF